jgi:Amidohydrolase family
MQKHPLIGSDWNPHPNLSLVASTPKPMFSEEDKIWLMHDCRTALLNRMFDELSRKPGSSAEQVSTEIIAMAQAIRNPLSKSDATLQQVVDSFIAGLLTDEAFDSKPANGKQADLAVISQDIFTVTHNSIAKTKVLLTIVGGKVVFKQED